MSSPTNNFVRPVLEVRSCPIDTTVNAGAINSGDCIYATQNTQPGAAALTTSGNAGRFIGVAVDTYPTPVGQGMTEKVVPNTALVDEIGGGLPGYIAGDLPGISYAVEGDFLFVALTGQVFTPWAPVYIAPGGDPQTVTATSNGSSIGTVAPDQRPLAWDNTQGDLGAFSGGNGPGLLGGSISGSAGIVFAIDIPQLVLVRIAPNLS